MELWENALAQRRGFRRLPEERLRLEDYFSEDRGVADTTYGTEAAVIEGYAFDRAGFRVAGTTFRAADMAHWMALDMASRALADAGFPDGAGLSREGTGVLIGNTLTGEFSRANTLRLRWPYARRVVDSALAREEWPSERREKFLAALEESYKAPFPAPGEETLAGGLSNTIAGRICNQFDLKGGGYTVDGACASSLLAVANACSALAAGDLQVALAGGVDLSIDPFEIIGFAKAGALSAEDMRVFDRRPAGFIPGEGCGMVVLMPHEEAVAQGRRVYAVIRGWGVSSDGAGGITRPELGGQIAALRRAYRRAGFGIDTVAYCEGHGTGTAVGDATELEALSLARREAAATAAPAVIGSVKANIGHTKAAAGIAGLIKAVMAVHTQVLPPTTGCEEPHGHLGGERPALRILREAEVWPSDRPLRASASAMGFGGINAHVVLEGLSSARRTGLSVREQGLSRSAQDTELFLLSAESAEALAAFAGKLREIAARVSRSEMGDLAAELERQPGAGGWRAAVVASHPKVLAEKLGRVESTLREGSARVVDMETGVFLAGPAKAPRIGFLFPGQGSPSHADGGLWRRRFSCVRELYAEAGLDAKGDSISTRVAQPAVITAEMAGLRVLAECGVTAVSATGHSLGELAALHWAGAYDEKALLRIARMRGAAMGNLGNPTGVMLAVAASREEAEALIGGERVAIAALNSARQTVLAGAAVAVDRVARAAAASGVRVSRLPVSHAFHTPLVAAAGPVLAEWLAGEKVQSVRRPVFSTVTGALLAEGEDLRELLRRQVTSPVLFTSAFAAMRDGVDLLIEVGPGAVLAGLARGMTDAPVAALDAGGESLKGLFHAAGAAFALGTPVKTAALFAGRFTRPFNLEWRPSFLASPCESAPAMEAPKLEGRLAGGEMEEPQEVSPAGAETPLELVRGLLVKRTELPVSAVRDESRMLSDLHLNSITVAQVVAEAARMLGIPRVAELTEFANASLEEIVRALEELKAAGTKGGSPEALETPPGVDRWVRTFALERVEKKRRPARDKRTGQPGGRWEIIAGGDDTRAGRLRAALERTQCNGVAVCLPEKPGMESIPLLLAGSRAAMAMPEAARLLVVQHGWGGGGFARTLHFENPAVDVCIVNLAPEGDADWERVAAEAGSAEGFIEVFLGKDGERREPQLRLIEPDAAPKSNSRPVGPGDVMLVTGGGKGIAAECALALARETGVRLALMGRSDPKEDRELAANLERFAGAGVTCLYARADVTDAEAAAGAVARAQRELGPVTAVLHGAGVNTPQLIGGLDVTTFRATVGPKVSGCRNVLAAIDPGKLRLLVTFGSIIARTGLPGEADYATANEWLAALTEEWGNRHSHCRCLTLEWSVWSGSGMGQRLGRIETLERNGITAISVDEGTRVFRECLRAPGLNGSLVVSGRFGRTPALVLTEPELPMGRFLERKRVYYPGVELVVEATLSFQSDPYLADHVVQRQPLLPGMLGLEAMAQGAMALAGSMAAPMFEDVEFLRPVVVAEGGAATVRIAALRREDGAIEVRLGSGETAFQTDHFRAVCRFGGKDGARQDEERAAMAHDGAGMLALDPARDLYGRLLFHGARFQRLRGYRELKARECVAEISADDGAGWFGPYLPGELALGDPGARDAALHCIQACVPHLRVLPVGLERMTILQLERGVRLVRARERRREGNEFLYDVEVTNAEGVLLERWEGLRLRAMESIPLPEVWPNALLGPYLERRLEELAPSAGLRVAAEEGDGGKRPGASAGLMRKTLGGAGRVWRRPDGRPVAMGEDGVSASKTGNLTLAVAGTGEVACDIEEVAGRSGGEWMDLLGEEKWRLAQRLADEGNEAVDSAATRVWSAMECMRKSGRPLQSPLVLESMSEGGWTVLRCGAVTIPTWVWRAAEGGWPSVVAFASGSGGAGRKAAALRQKLEEVCA